MCWIPVIVVKGYVFVKSTLGWIYLQREVCHAHEAFFFFPLQTQSLHIELYLLLYSSF